MNHRSWKSHHQPLRTLAIRRTLSSRSSTSLQPSLYIASTPKHLLFLPDDDRDQDIESKQKFYHKAIQWNVVPKARMAVNEAKAKKKAGLAETMGDIERSDVKHDGKLNHVEFKG